MKIHTIVQKYKNIIEAITECEFCGHQERIGYYGNDEYHKKMIPTRKCFKCFKSTNN